MLIPSALATLQTCLNNVCAGRVNCVAYAPDTILDPLYELLWVKPYNLAIDVTPAAVIRPESTEDVAAIVQCCGEIDYKVQAKSGGHSYANFGLGDGAITVDLVNFQNYSIDEISWYATIGAGMSLGDIDQNLHKTGRALPHGLCPGVGIGGHATVGGLGPMSRMWGALLDHVVEVEVVIANGTILRANQSSNSDIFYAIRGAGASFGIVTEFVMSTEPEPDSVVQYNFDLILGDSPDSLADFYMQWQSLIADPDLDRRFGTQLIITPIGALIMGTFYGTEAEWTASGIPARLPTNKTVIITDWLGSLTNWAEQEALYLTNTPIFFYSKSLGFRQQDILSQDSANELFTDLVAQPKDTPLWFIVFDAEGGAINDVPTNATAYAHRNKIMFYQSYAVDEFTLTELSRDFLTDFHDDLVALLPLNDTDRGTYPGYVDLNISGGAQEQYWESNLPDLTLLKSIWDPNDVFHNPQSILPLS